MTRIVLALLVLCALGGGPSSIQGAPPVPPVPFKAGDTWVYRVTQTAGSRLGTNTLTMRYLGKRDYRGTLYHFSDSHSSSSPGVVERDILTWSGLYFRQRATILYENSQQTLEIVFDRPYAFSGIPEELSGTIEIYERSQYAGKGSWAIEVVWGGTVKVTVPAGTFTAEKWKGTLRIGRLKKDYTVYTVGPLEIKTDIDVLKGGELMDRTRTELVKGPIPKH